MEDLWAAVVMPELQQMMDTQPDASVEAQTHIHQTARSFTLFQ